MSNEKEHAIALLSTVRNVMTRTEIEVCEKIIEESDEWGFDEWEEFDDESRDVLTLLETQFAAEIGKAMAGKGVAK